MSSLYVNINRIELVTAFNLLTEYLRFLILKKTRYKRRKEAKIDLRSPSNTEAVEVPPACGSVPSTESRS